MNTFSVLILLVLASYADSQYIPMYRNFWPSLMPAQFRPGYHMAHPKVSSTTTPNPQKRLDPMVEAVEECYFNQSWKLLQAEDKELSSKQKLCTQLAYIPPGSEGTIYQQDYQRMAMVEKRDKEFVQQCYWQRKIVGDPNAPCDNLPENMDSVKIFADTPRGQYRLRVYQRMKQAEELCNTPFANDLPMCEDYNSSKPATLNSKKTLIRRRSPRKSTESGDKWTRPISA